MNRKMEKYLVDTYGQASQRVTLFGNTTLYDVLIFMEKFVRAHPELSKKGN